MNDEKVILAIGQFIWGKGSTKKEAKAKAESLGGSTSPVWVYFEVHPDTYVNEYGSIIYPADADPPKEIEKVTS